MLYATVRQRKIHVKKPVTVIQNGIGVDWLILDMDDEWKGMDSIVCVFTNGETAKEMLHSFGEPVQVPWECLKGAGLLSVSVTGYVDGEKVMTTMMPDDFWNVVQNGPVTGDAPMVPTPDLYEQVLAAAGAANAAATRAAETCEQLLKDKADGVFRGADGLTPSIRVGSVTTSISGGDAEVLQSGTPTDVVLNFVLPRGIQGVPGPEGKPGLTGATGRGIKDVYANSDGSWMFVFSDGTMEIISNDAYEAGIAAANAGAGAAYNAANMANQEAGNAADQAAYAEQMGLYAASAGSNANKQANDARNTLAELKAARENGEFDGDQGPAGPQGERGDPGYPEITENDVGKVLVAGADQTPQWAEAGGKAVLTTEQVLTEREKAQARENIDMETAVVELLLSFGSLPVVLDQDGSILVEDDNVFLLNL